MELAASAFLAAAPAAAAGAEIGAAGAMAGAVAAAPAAAATTAAAGSGVLSALQGGATIASMVSSLFAGVSGYQSHQSQSRFAEINAEQTRLAAEEDALRIKREMVQRIGANRVAFAASGLDISSGAAIEDGLRSQADFEIGLNDARARAGYAGGMAKAGSLSSQGTGSLVASAAKALGTGVDYALDLKRRG